MDADLTKQVEVLNTKSIIRRAFGRCWDARDSRSVGGNFGAETFIPMTASQQKKKVYRDKVSIIRFDFLVLIIMSGQAIIMPPEES